MRLADAPDGDETEADARLAGMVSSHVRNEEAVEQRRLDTGPRILHVEVHESIGRVTFAFEDELRRSERRERTR
jgi:hypothetical protein